MNKKSISRVNTLLRKERLLQGWSQQDLADRLDITIVTVNRWERGVQQPSPLFRLKLCALFGKSEEELGLVSATLPSSPHGEEKEAIITEVMSPVPHISRLWSVPYPRNPFFTGREDILQGLHRHLSRESPLALTHSWAISGLGGIGKTQIALEYAYRYRQAYRFIFWTSAAARETLLTDLVNIADLLQLPQRAEQDQQKVVAAVKRWLAAHQEWLWILDNADDLAMVRDFVPLECPGHLIFTSRAQAFGALAQRIEVKAMSLSESTLFLLRRARFLAPEASLDQVPEDQLAAAQTIALEMDLLPLALDQAGAYIEEVGCSLLTYLDLYRTHRKELLHRRGQMSDDHPEPVATTWSLSFQLVEQTNPAANELLRVCAFLAPDAIPEEMINEGATLLGPVLASVAADPFQFNLALKELLACSLIQRNAHTKTLTIHRLVQIVLKQSLTEEAQRQWAECIVRVVNHIFPNGSDAATWLQYQRYLPHALLSASYIADWSLTSPEGCRLLQQTGVFLQEHAQYTKAEALLQEALRIRRQTLGEMHSDVAESVASLAVLFAHQDKYVQAESFHKHALMIREHTLGEKHMDVTDSLNDLAVLYCFQRNYAQAEPLFKRALAIRKQILEPEHPAIAESLHNLASLYHGRGQYEQAESMYQQALVIREKALGSEHLFVAYGLSNLAYLSSALNKYPQAEQLFQRALMLLERILGPEHPEVAGTLRGFGQMYTQQGKYAQAEPLLQRACTIFRAGEASFGARFAVALGALGQLFIAQSQYAQAEQLLQQALALAERTYGLEHPEVATLLDYQATLHAQQNQYAQAHMLYQRAITIYEQVLGGEHPLVAKTLNNLADLYVNQGQYIQAEPLYQRASHIREHTLGKDHPDTVTTYLSLLQLKKKADKATNLAEQSISATESEQVGSTTNGGAQRREISGAQRREIPVCPYCQQTDTVSSSGQNRNGSYRFRCHSCQRYFTPNSDSQGYDPSLRSQALALAQTGASFRTIAQSLGVHHRTISRWVKLQQRSASSIDGV